MFIWIFQCIIVLEMTATNLWICYSYSKKKYAPWITILILALFTALLFVCFLPFFDLMDSSSPQNRGNGLFVLLGTFYILPSYFLFDQKLIKTVGIICSSWTFTMGLFMLSVQISTWIPNSFFETLCCVQTILYMGTIPVFYLFFKDRFMFIYANLTDKRLKKFVCIGLLWFCTMVVVNVQLVMNPWYTKILLIVLLIVNAYLTYTFMYEVLKANRDYKRLETTMGFDRLTMLPNRDRLFSDLDKLIMDDEPFKVVFLDLDDFKSINDTFGHLAGDEYLKVFSTKARSSSGMGCLYRLSGDEFIYICNSQESVDLLLKAIQKLDTCTYTFGNSFLGVSYGVASYPQDAQSPMALIGRADKLMYTAKESRKNRIN